ncbi:mannan endo-1,6-alpha-mannosidase DCW1-like protein [Bombardia bombarda]|uniref:Mannan endo-1,6-alpha-mannosidase n=1 Tax=Bombardia bombarda TaxID=252184 RepID=A0AA39XN09_9PEZI|nr:mannan endo-1,6-alpha-mannosidase DCW1-like protein [Bombardia bombarda]
MVPGASAAESPYKIDTRENIIDSSRTLAYDLIKFYNGNESGEIPGLLPGPPTEENGDYYWWEGGVYWATYIDYFRLTGDTTYNDLVTQGMLHQTGPNNDFMPPNATVSMGNDDQCFWAIAAMSAAENEFPNPPSGSPQWLDLAKAVFFTQADPSRNDDTCGGGLRWQILPFNVGYNFKNSASNACFFNLAARLARFTGNDTYAAHAASTYDWLTQVGFIDNQTHAVYDGGHTEKNCTDINKAQFSYNSAFLVEGAAFMYNLTTNNEWKTRTDALVNATLSFFFPDDVAFELPCEGKRNRCTTDMYAFKGLTHRGLAAAAQVAPYTAEVILPVLKTSAKAAVGQCTGGDSGRACGFYWSEGEYVEPESSTGVGEQMSVLLAVTGLLVDGAAVGPVTADTKTTAGGGSGTEGAGSGNGTSTAGGGGGGGAGGSSTTGGSSSSTETAKSAAAEQARVGGVLIAAVVGLGVWVVSL